MDLKIINFHFNLKNKEENRAYNYFSGQLHTTWFHLLKPLFDIFDINQSKYLLLTIAYHQVIEPFSTEVVATSSINVSSTRR
jgi:hypothetical protein